MARKTRKLTEDAEIDLTPMLDIVFIMLIFFIVTAVFVKEPGAEVEKPEAETTAGVKTVSVLVAITEDNKIFIDKKEVDVRAVRPAVEGMLAENPNGAVVIQADKESEIQFLTDVMDQVNDAGARVMTISTEEAK